MITNKRLGYHKGHAIFADDTFENVTHYLGYQIHYSFPTNDYPWMVTHNHCVFDDFKTDYDAYAEIYRITDVDK
jgi:hypothetical protein